MEDKSNGVGQGSIQINHDEDEATSAPPPIASPEEPEQPDLNPPTPSEPSPTSFPLNQETPKDYDPSKYFFDTSTDPAPSDTLGNKNVDIPSATTKEPIEQSDQLKEDLGSDPVSDQYKYSFDTTPEPPRNDSQPNSAEIFKPSYNAPSEAENKAEELPIPTANIFTNDEIPKVPVKTRSSKKWIILPAIGVFIIAVIGFSTVLIMNQKTGFKQFTLINQSTRYTFKYYSDSIAGNNLYTGYKQLTGNNKSLTSVSIDPITGYTSCEKLSKSIKTIGKVKYKNGSFNICGSTQDEVIIFKNASSYHIFEIYSVNKKSNIDQVLLNKIFNSLNIN